MVPFGRGFGRVEVGPQARITGFYATGGRGSRGFHPGRDADRAGHNRVEAVHADLMLGDADYADPSLRTRITRIHRCRRGLRGSIVADADYADQMT